MDGMSPIKILLITPFVLFIAVYAARLRNRTVYRLAFIGIAALAILLVAVPDATMTVAHWVGVGRGTDLVFYVGGVAVFFAIVVLYSRIRELEEMQADLVRQIAIREAQDQRTARDTANEPAESC